MAGVASCGRARLRQGDGQDGPKPGCDFSLASRPRILPRSCFLFGGLERPAREVTVEGVRRGRRAQRQGAVLSHTCVAVCLRAVCVCVFRCPVPDCAPAVWAPVRVQGVLGPGPAPDQPAPGPMCSDSRHRTGPPGVSGRGREPVQQGPGDLGGHALASALVARPEPWEQQPCPLGSWLWGPGGGLRWGSRGRVWAGFGGQGRGPRGGVQAGQEEGVWDRWEPLPCARSGPWSCSRAGQQLGPSRPGSRFGTSSQVWGLAWVQGWGVAWAAGDRRPKPGEPPRGSG